jgi:type I restriction enzyme S subunit
MTSGNLAEGWRRATVGEIAKVVGGGTPPTAERSYWGGDVPWLTPRDLSGFGGKLIGAGARSLTAAGLRASSATLLPRNSVLLTSRAPIGHVAIASNEVSTNQGFKSFICGPELLPDFLYWYLKSSKSELMRLASGTTFLELSKRSAEKIPLPLPPIAEQRLIVAAIEAQVARIDHGLELAGKVLGRLALWHEVLIRSALNGRLNDGDYEDAGELLSAVLSRREVMVGSRTPASTSLRRVTKTAPVAAGLARPTDLPTRFGWASLDELCPIFVDCEHRTPRPSPGGVPALRPRDIVGGQLHLEHTMRVDADEFKNQTARHVPEAGDIIYSRELSYGWAVVVPEDVQLCLGQGMVLFRPDPLIDPALVVHFLNSALGRRQAHKAASGTAHPHINLDRIRAFALPVLPAAAQVAVREMLEMNIIWVSSAELSLRGVRARALVLKTAIMTAAFTGRLTRTNRGRNGD